MVAYFEVNAEIILSVEIPIEEATFPPTLQDVLNWCRELAEERGYPRFFLGVPMKSRAHTSWIK